jgi:single-stranded DNA-binding protein
MEYSSLFFPLEEIMNSIVLMAQITSDPQLRYTEQQTPVTETYVQFDGLQQDDRPSILRVVAWGNLAQDVQEQFKIGDRVILEGRIGISSFDHPQGFKEKRAELTVSRIYRADGTSPALSSTPNSVPVSVPVAATAPTAKAKRPSSKVPSQPQPVGAGSIPGDDIPF